MYVHINCVVVPIPKPVHDVMEAHALLFWNGHAYHVVVGRHVRHVVIPSSLQNKGVLVVLVAHEDVGRDVLSLPTKHPMERTITLGFVAVVLVALLHLPGKVVRLTLAVSVVATMVEPWHIRGHVSDIVPGQSFVDVFFHPLLVVVVVCHLFMSTVEGDPIVRATVTRRPLDGHSLSRSKLCVDVGRTPLPPWVRCRCLSACSAFRVQPVVRVCWLAHSKQAHHEHTDPSRRAATLEKTSDRHRE
mmetsp:Transcript_12661/g.25828  ORF Transcript_12661/g.25828 Transcript_12661/m.25828 type:complete len:245 (-) Transcript_12661:243-977(-)